MVADRLLMIGLGLLVLSISSAVLLILDVVLGQWFGRSVAVSSPCPAR